MWKRIAIVVAIVAAVLWLGFSEPPRQQKLAKIAAAMQAGKAATLDPVTAHRFATVATDTIKLASPNTRFVINELPDENTLAIITYDSRLPSEINYGVGNAVYDPTLDIIFLDESVISLDRLIGVPSKPSYSDLNAPLYASFLLLHELAHRNLHVDIRKSSLFNVWSDAQRLEFEADEFAARNLLSAYDKPETFSLISTIGTEMAQSVGLKRERLQGHELFYADLAGTLRMINQLYLIGMTRYDPGYESDTHPPLVERTKRMLATEPITSLGGDLAAHREVTVEWLNRLEQTMRRPKKEFESPFPVVAIGVSESHLLLLGNTEYLLIAERALSMSIDSTSPITIERRHVPASLQQMIEDGLPYVFHDKKYGWLLMDRRQPTAIFSLQETPGRSAIPFSQIDDMVIPPGPSGLIFIRQGTSFAIWKEGWHVIELDEATKNISEVELLRSVKLSALNADNSHVYLSLLQEGSSPVLRGISIFDLDESRLKPPCLLKNPIPVESRAIYAFHAAPSEASSECKDLRLVLARLDEGKLEVFEVESESRHLYEFKTHDAALRNHDLWMDYPSVWSAATHCCTSGRIVVSHLADSVYSIDLQNGKVDVVFHPYSDPVVLRNGRVLITPMWHSFSTYLLDLSQKE